MIIPLNKWLDGENTPQMNSPSQSEGPNAELTKSTLQHAINKHKPDTRQLIFHSDQEVQYSANLFVDSFKDCLLFLNM
jgi:transposase InsO family protein